MRVTITRIDNLKHGNGADFKRIYFKTEAGDWAKADLVPTYRNYAKWKPFLEEGIVLDNIEMKDGKTVDADSRPTLVRRPPPPPAKQLQLL